MDEERNRARESCHKESPPPDAGASHAPLQLGIGILRPFRGLTPSTCLHRSVIHLLSTWNSELKDLSCEHAFVLTLCTRLSIVVKRHWRDTGQLILF